MSIKTGPATLADTEEIAAAVTELLRELRAEPAYVVKGLNEAVVAAIEGAASGGILTARDPATGRLTGVLGYSVTWALRLAGDYCLIQELWVAPRARSQRIAAALLEALAEFCSRQALSRIEVCLPSEGFPEVARTLAFYERNGFRAIGPRMIRNLE